MLLVDTTQTAYKELFTITFLHPAFEKNHTYRVPVTNVKKTVIESSIFSNILVRPDTATGEFFAGYSIEYRCSNNILMCFVRINGQKPYINFANDFVPRFLINSTTDFINKTDVSVPGSQDIFLFTNRTHTGINKFITMHEEGVNDDDLEGLDIVKPEEKCFAVIDIFPGGNGAGYNLLDGSGQLESPGFNIRFKSTTL